MRKIKDMDKLTKVGPVLNVEQRCNHDDMCNLV